MEKIGKDRALAGAIAVKISVEHYNPYAARRDRWEMNTVKGPRNGRTDCLLTLTERKTRSQIIRKLPDGKAASAAAVLNAIERESAASPPRPTAARYRYPVRFALKG